MTTLTDEDKADLENEYEKESTPGLSLADLEALAARGGPWAPLYAALLDAVAARCVAGAGSDTCSARPKVSGAGARGRPDWSPRLTRDHAIGSDAHL